MSRFRPYLFLCCALGLIACQKPPEPVAEVVRPVQVLTINLMDQKNFTFPGQVTPSQQAYLAFKVPGKIKRWHVHAGQKVEKGQLLVELDSAEYRLILEAAQANYDLSLIKHQRNQVLIKQQLIAQDKLEKSISQLSIAEAELQQAKLNLSYCQIVAPYSGIIAATYFKDFQYAQPLQRILTLHAHDAVDISFDLPERLINSFAMFDPTDDKHITANVTFSFAANQTFKASFKDINTVADNKTGSYRIRLTLPQPDNLNILPGMSAEVGLTLTIPQTDITQQLPKAAVMVEDDKYWVWRITPSNQLEKTYVFLDEQFNIIAGLQDADRIVAAGGDELSSHQVVKPWTKEKGL